MAQPYHNNNPLPDVVYWELDLRKEVEPNDIKIETATIDDHD
jgi:hypothetical protein